MKDAKIMVTYQPLSSKSLPNFFRIALYVMSLYMFMQACTLCLTRTRVWGTCCRTCVPEPTEQDVDTILEEMERAGEQIPAALLLQ